MEDWNRTIFATINASADPDAMLVATAVAIASYAVFAVPLVLGVLWLWGRPTRRGGLVVTLTAAVMALACNQLIALVWFHPRPFALRIGRTLIPHANDSSFPSDHVTVLVATGLGLWLWARYRSAALVLLILAVPVAWSRVFLGVHFPLDVVGAVATACTGQVFATPSRAWIDRTVMPRLVEPIYRTALSLPIERGWVRP